MKRILKLDETASAVARQVSSRDESLANEEHVSWPLMVSLVRALHGWGHVSWGRRVWGCRDFR